MKRFWPVALAIVLLLVLLSPLASESPDGLEWAIERHAQVPGHEAGQAPAAPLPDYAMPGVANPSVATMLAGLAGTAAVFAVALAVGWLVSFRRKPVARGPGVDAGAAS